MSWRRGEGRQSVGAPVERVALARDALGQPGAKARRGGGKPAFVLGEVAGQQRRAQAARDVGEADAAALDPADQPGGQAVGGAVEPLARAVEQGFGPWQGAGQIAQALAARRHPLPQSLGHAGALPFDPGQELEPHRHGHFRRRRRRRRAAVGDIVDQGGVGLVADGGNQRDRRGGGGAGDNLFVEAPEIFDAAATTGDDQEIGARDAPAGFQRVEPGNGAGHFRGAFLALHGHGPQEHLARETVAQAVQDVADHGARG